MKRMKERKPQKQSTASKKGSALFDEMNRKVQKFKDFDLTHEQTKAIDGGNAAKK